MKIKDNVIVCNTILYLILDFHNFLFSFLLSYNFHLILHFFYNNHPSNGILRNGESLGSISKMISIRCIVCLQYLFKGRKKHKNWYLPKGMVKRLEYLLKVWAIFLLPLRYLLGTPFLRLGIPFPSTFLVRLGYLCHTLGLRFRDTIRWRCVLYAQSIRFI